jgi:AcrR family transcriptional regulator
LCDNLAVARSPARTRTTTENGSSGPAKPTKRRDQEVLEAAARIFYERGYADTSVQDIADELGILKGSLYHYIDTKEDLLFRLLDGTHADVHQILKEIDGQSDLGPLEALELYIRRQLEYNIDHFQNVSVYYHDFERLSDERQKKILARRREHQRWVTDRVEAAQAAGLAEPSVDAGIASRCIFATIIWTYRWFRPGRDRKDLVVEACTSFAMRGVVGDV